jgi:hypothetical protein
MEAVVRLFEAGGVRPCFSRHEHNFHHNRRNGIDYFVSGAGSKVRRRTPGGFAAAHTESWSGECHVLVATIDGDRMTVRAIGESPEGTLAEIARQTPSGEPVQGPIVVT